MCSLDRSFGVIDKATHQHIVDVKQESSNISFFDTDRKNVTCELDTNLNLKTRAEPEKQIIIIHHF